MKNILQFFQPASQSASTSDTGWEKQNQSSNIEEDISMDIGNILQTSLSDQLSESQQRTMLVAQVAISKLFTNKHFSICTLDSVIDVIGKGRTNSNVYKQLRALHCIDYADMPPELRNKLPHMVNELLTNKPDDFIATNIALNGVFD